MNGLQDRLQGALGERYRVDRELGHGGMGAVFLAHDMQLRRNVAIKVLPPELGFSAEYRSRFYREARTAAGLSHPNIVPIHDVGESEDLVWFVMTYVEGETLREKVARVGPLPSSLARRYLTEIAQALAYAHASGVVHRDVKPENILIDRGSGRASLTDFGISRVRSATGTALTASGALIGTPRYMSPEQAMGEEIIDGRSDTYAVGLCGYFMLKGEDAIQATSLQALIAAHVRGVNVDLSNADSSLPAPLIRTVEKCLARRPDDRYPRLEEFIETLLEIGDDRVETPPEIRTFLRSTQTAFLFLFGGAAVLGWVGVAMMPAALIGLIALLFAAPWVQALAQITRRGATWATIRRGILSERARRAEEAAALGKTRTRVVDLLVIWVFILLVMICFLELRTDRTYGLNAGLNVGLFLFSLLGVLLLGSIFGLAEMRRRAALRSHGLQYGMIALNSLIVFAFMLGYSHFTNSEASGLQLPGNWIGVGPLLTAVVAAVGAFFAGTLPRSRKALATADEGNWHVPRWLDVAGSWLFGRFERDGRRIRFRRDPLSLFADPPNITSTMTLIRPGVAPAPGGDLDDKIHFS